MFLTLYGEKFFPLNRAYHSHSQKIPAQMAGTCPWHGDLRRGKGHSQPPDYRTYSAEVTGPKPQSPASSQYLLVRPRMVRPSQALLSYSMRPELSSLFFSVFYKNNVTFLLQSCQKPTAFQTRLKMPLLSCRHASQSAGCACRTPCAARLSEAFDLI